MRPVQDLQCCALQSKQAEAEGQRGKSDMAGQAGKGNEADTMCVHRSGEGTAGSSAQPYNLPGCGYHRALGPQDKRQVVVGSFIYKPRPLTCTQIGVWDLIRTLKQCQQPTHNPT